MNRYTDQQVKEQKERFDAFMNSANLVKIGKTWINILHNEFGYYNTYNYIQKVLKLANVSHCMYDPTDLQRSYGEILTMKALNHFLDSQK